MNMFLKWQNSKATRGKYTVFLLIGAFIFPFLIPTILVFLLPRVDKIIGIAPFYKGWVNIAVGIIAIILGGFIALSTILAQIKFASGTPFPMLPTKKLLVTGPFEYCRNPMTLGTIMVYSGIAVLIGSFSAVLFIVLFTLILLAYIKLVEEKELALRFGQEYLDYKKVTPFIIPNSFVTSKKVHK
jgi:protein-S-isoprenylcysteine O-methyltransferase Ste14